MSRVDRIIRLTIASILMVLGLFLTVQGCYLVASLTLGLAGILSVTGF